MDDTHLGVGLITLKRMDEAYGRSPPPLST